MEGSPLNDEYYTELKKRVWMMLDGIYGTIYLKELDLYRKQPDSYESEEFKNKWKTKVGRLRSAVININISRQYCGADSPHTLSSPEHLLAINVCCAALKALTFENWYNHISKGKCIELLTRSGKISILTARKKLNERIELGYYAEVHDGINRKTKYIVPTPWHLRLRAVLAFASYCDVTAGMIALEELNGATLGRQDIWTNELLFDPTIIEYAVSEKQKEFSAAKYEEN